MLVMPHVQRQRGTARGDVGRSCEVFTGGEHAKSASSVAPSWFDDDKFADGERDAVFEEECLHAFRSLTTMRTIAVPPSPAH